MTGDLEFHAAALAAQGYTVIADVLDAAQIDHARTALDGVLAKEGAIGQARGWRNDSHHVAYLLPQKDAAFRGLGLNPRLLPLMRRMLGEDCKLDSINGLAMRPYGGGQILHMDAPQSTPGTCVWINTLHCLDDFDAGNGATRLVPRSHLTARARAEPASDQESAAITVTAPAGSVIAYDGALLHAGSPNGTAAPRRALHLLYRRAWAQPVWDYPRSFSPAIRARLTPEEKALFGFSAIPHIYDPHTHMVTGTYPHPAWKRRLKSLYGRFFQGMRA